MWDISNPFLPREVGYYLSPRYPGRFPNRQFREVFQDRDTGLIYLADANGSGITVLRWTGPIPPRPPGRPPCRAPADTARDIEKGETSRGDGRNGRPL